MKSKAGVHSELLVSIVTPSFRQLDWLRLAMASVADQKGVCVEHVIQDGGSDGIREAFAATAEALAATNYQPRLVVEQDKGMYDAINRGLKSARGEICAYLNCDEQYLPGTLDQVVRFFAAHPGVDVLFGDAVLVNAEGTPLSYRRTILPSLGHLRVADLNTLTCATFYRRRVLEAGHFFSTHLKIAGDQLWIYRLLKAGVAMQVLPRPLSVFAFTGTNLSHSESAVDERAAWLPVEERLNPWTKPFLVATHRLRKLVAGAYRSRDVSIDVFRPDDILHRQKMSARVGFRWPQSPGNAPL